MNQPEDPREPGFHPDSARDRDRSVTARQEQDTGQRPGSVVTAARALDTDGGRQRDLRLRTVERPDEEQRDEERLVEQTQQQDGPQAEQGDPAEDQVQLRRDEQLVQVENSAAKHEAAMLRQQAADERTNEQVDDRAVDDPSTSVREDELGLAEGDQDRGMSYGHDAQAGRAAAVENATQRVDAMNSVPKQSLDNARQRGQRVAAAPSRQQVLARSRS